MRWVAPESAHASSLSWTKSTTSVESRSALAKVLREDDASALDAEGERFEGLKEAVCSEAGADCEVWGIGRMGGSTEG